MKKTKRIIAMFVVMAMLATNLVMLLSNISIAKKNDVTVVVKADSDSSITLSDGVINDKGQLERRGVKIYLL